MVARSAFLYLAACGASLAGLSSCVYPTGPIDWERWTVTFPEHISIPVEKKIARIESHLVNRHLGPEGFLVYRRPDREFDPDEPGNYTNLADTPMWTGCLAAAAAFKYGVTGEDTDRALLLRAVRGVRFLEEVTGKGGLLARGVRRAAVPMRSSERPHQEWRPAAPPREDYRYRGDPSKDQYIGVLFGFAATTHVLELGPGRGDPDVRREILPLTAGIADHIWENDLRIVDVDGKRTRFGDLSGFIAGVPIGPNAELVLGWQMLAWRLSGERKYFDRYRALVRKGYHRATAWNKFQFLGITNHNNDVMAMMGLYTLAILEEDLDRRATYQAHLRQLWAQLRNEANLFYHGVYAAASGERLPPEALVDVEKTFALFPVDLRLTPVDLTDHPLVERSFFNGRHGTPRNRTALPLHLRPLSSFIWKSSPYALRGNESQKGEMAVSGVDYLLAYWMARYYGIPIGSAMEP